jgi:hypothetical protein
MSKIFPTAALSRPSVARVCVEVDFLKQTYSQTHFDWMWQ